MSFGQESKPGMNAWHKNLWNMKWALIVSLWSLETIGLSGVAESYFYAALIGGKVIKVLCMRKELKM